MAALSCVRAALIDLSGTLHIENFAIPGAIDALKRLRQENVAVRFVTNTTKESKRFLHNRLTSLGFEIDDSEIFTSLVAAREHVEKNKLRPMLLLEKQAMEDFQGIDTSNPNAVVVGLSPTMFDYSCLNEAFRLILDGASLVAIHKARYFKQSGGLSLGPGPFVSALEYATGKTAHVVGKPEKRFFLGALLPLNVPPEHTVMIGDDARDDIVGAQECGMTGILVRTGKFRAGDEISANHTVDSFPEAVELILNSKKQGS